MDGVSEDNAIPITRPFPRPGERWTARDGVVVEVFAVAFNNTNEGGPVVVFRHPTGVMWWHPIDSWHSDFRPVSR